MTVFCKDCKHRLKSAGGLDNDPNALCQDSPRMNWVTGEKELTPCKDVNLDGECPDFEPKNPNHLTGTGGDAPMGILTMKGEK